MRRGIASGGNFIVDYVKMVDVYPAEQTLANIGKEFSGSGGAPYNVLLDLARLGADFPLEAIGLIGEDEAGQYILDDCQANGIDTRQLATTGAAPTSYTLVMVVEGSGRRTFFHQRGANALLGPAHFDFSATSASHFHYGYLLLLDALDAADGEFGTKAARVLAAAKEAGLTTSVDLVSEDSDRFGRIVPSALRYADFAFMNEFEASRLTGLDLTHPDPDLAGRAYESLGYSGTLLIHWPDGAASCSPSGTVWQGRVLLPPERIASVAGSGDAFAAGYLLGYLRGYEERRRLRLGVCCAAASITDYTCCGGVVPEAECLRLGETFGFAP
ncbi:MAG TPA: carbohydrate kinase family protein [Fimbriimonadaceae bacterium]|nr:carbohydrate kinase family protein [Fimbriimonadaceae bacterium]